jgi:hypothetical protein
MEFLLPNAEGLVVDPVLGEVAPESVLCGCVTAEEPAAAGFEVVVEPELLTEPGELAWLLGEAALLLEPAPAAPVVPGTLPVCASATVDNNISAKPDKLANANGLELVRCFIFLLLKDIEMLTKYSLSGVTKVIPTKRTSAKHTPRLDYQLLPTLRMSVAKAVRMRARAKDNDRTGCCGRTLPPSSLESPEGSHTIG